MSKCLASGFMSFMSAPRCEVSCYNVGVVCILRHLNDLHFSALGLHRLGILNLNSNCLKASQSQWLPIKTLSSALIWGRCPFPGHMVLRPVLMFTVLSCANQSRAITECQRMVSPHVDAIYKHRVDSCHGD